MCFSVYALNYSIQYVAEPKDPNWLGTRAAKEEERLTERVMSQATPLRHAGKPAQAADVVRINVSGTKYSVGKFMLQEKILNQLRRTDIQ